MWRDGIKFRILKCLIRHHLDEEVGDLALTAGDEGTLIQHTREDLELLTQFQIHSEMWSIPARLCSSQDTEDMAFHSEVTGFFAPLIFTPYYQERKCYGYWTPSVQREDVCVRARICVCVRVYAHSFKRRHSKSDVLQVSRKNKRKEGFWYALAFPRCTPCLFHVPPISVELMNHTRYFSALKGQFLSSLLSCCQSQLKLVERKFDALSALNKIPSL